MKTNENEQTPHCGNLAVIASYSCQITQPHPFIKPERWIRFTRKTPKIGRSTYQKENENLPDNVENVSCGEYRGHDLSCPEQRGYFENAVWQYP